MTDAPRAAHAPATTYRLQLRGGVDLHRAAGLVPTLASLGVTHLYLSPLAQARPGSDHGYDVVDPGRVDDALGGQPAWDHLAAEARRHGLGLVVDVVPDHLAADAANVWWRDVLRHGPASPHADWFDVDWDAPSLPGRVLLPLLQRPLSDAVAAGDVRFALRDEVEVEVAGQRLPLDPATYTLLLDGAPEARDLVEAARAVPRRARGEPRLGPAEALLAEVRQRLGAMLAGRGGATDGGLREAVRRRVEHLNGPDGHGHALLLLDAQAYALAPWQEAPARIRHRRFFDINDLVGLRPHHPGAFEALHAWLLREAERGTVAGVRVDHVDGLGDPEAYLRSLRTALPGHVRVFVEKITAPDEVLPDWPVDGTTGYDAMAHLDALQVDADGLRRLEAAHAEATGRPPFPDVARRAAHHVMEHLFPGILDDLARRLHLALGAPDGPPAADLRAAVAAVTADLPVYRTYTRDRVRAEDRPVLEHALAAARDQAPGPAVDALARVLLSPADEAQRRWLERWQQWSPAVHAKAVEDTALYRSAALLSLNEVGQEPDRPPTGTAAFLRFAAARARGPAGLTATTTHDTKMSEDARARLHVLSHRPEAFTDLHRHLLERVPPVDVEGRPAPGPAMAWRLLQTLLGVWPLHGDEVPGLRQRLREHVVKASREAKVRTDWLEPDEAYEAALQAYVDRLVDAAAGDEVFQRVAETVALHGMVASLATVVLRCTLPGTPDLYQGLESWRFLLVDPDNRRPVDFDRMGGELAALDGARPDPAALLRSWRDGRVKLHVTAACLRHRRDAPDAYGGDLEPCVVEDPEAGPEADAGTAGDDGGDGSRAVAFLRTDGAAPVLVVVPRRSAAWSEDVPVGAAWGDAVVRLPPDAPKRWHDVLTGRVVSLRDGALPLSEALGVLPVAVFSAPP